MVMVNELLVNLVGNVLGSGHRTSKGNLSYHCPFCNHVKPKLEVNFTENQNGSNPWHCWACDNKGKTIKTLFKKLKVDSKYFQELGKLIKNTSSFKDETPITSQQLTLPPEAKSPITSTSRSAKHSLSYLKNRGILKSDIIKYNIRYCESGLYSNMIIIPSYNNNGELNYFTARSIEKKPYIKYRNPDTSRDVIPFELFINWDLPIILCEGPFDAIAIKRNAIPLFGKNISNELMKKIVTSKVQKVYIALDNDALKKALDFCETLINLGKEVYLVELPGKDPSELGFESFTLLLQKTLPLTSYMLMEKKLSLV